MYGLLRRGLFTLPTELSHDLSLNSISLANQMGVSGLLTRNVPPNPVTVMGIEFPNPVGLAAGLDKNARHIDGLAALGFGFVEVGTVTPKPQAGNPQPRLFRLPKARAIINRMGFNNDGVDALVDSIDAAAFKGVLGINIGKNKETPAERAAEDYTICMQRVYSRATYITVNLSSPNTPGLRDLQFGQPLIDLITTLKQEQRRLADLHGRYVPLAVKIAPDMADDDLREVAGVFAELEIDGLIATNTTVARDKVAHLKHGDEMGGLSGAPVRDASTHAISVLSQALAGALPIIGVGGIADAESAAEKIAAGAVLVQLYTGFIYEGPTLIAEAAKGVASAMAQKS